MVGGDGIAPENSRPFDVWVDTRFYHPTRHAPFFSLPRRILFAVVKGRVSLQSLRRGDSG